MPITVTGCRRHPPSAAGVVFDPGALPVGSATYTVPGSGVIWVAKTGSDTTGTGTSGQPYASIKKAASVAVAGSTVVVRAGVYREGGFYPSLGGGISIPAADVTIQAAPSEAVWLDGSDVVTGWTADTTSVPGRTVWRAPFVLTVDRAKTQVRGETASDWGDFQVEEFPLSNRPEMCGFDDYPVAFTQVATLAEVTTGTYYVEGTAGSGNNWVSSAYVIGSDPTGHTVYVGARARALTNGQERLTLRGFGVRRYIPSLADWGCLYLGGSSASVTKVGLLCENLVVEEISVLAMKVEIAGATVRKCTFRRNGQEDISAGFADDLLVEHNHFEATNHKVFNYGPDSGAIKLCRADRITFRYNRLKDVQTHGYWADQCCVGGVVHGNLFDNTWGRAVLVEISDSHLVVDNIIRQAGTNSPIARRRPYQGPGISSSGSNRCYFGHNTIVDSAVPVSFSQDSRTLTGPYTNVWDNRRNLAWHQENCSWDITKGGWWNNLIVYATTAYNAINCAFVSIDQPYSHTNLSGAVLRAGGNIYSRRAAGIPSRFGLSYPAGAIKVYSSLTATGGGTYDPPTSWQSEYGEVGTVLTTDATPFTSESTFTPDPTLIAQATAQPEPSFEWAPFVTSWMPTVASLLAASPWDRTGATIGAGSAPIPL